MRIFKVFGLFLTIIIAQANDIELVKFYNQGASKAQER